MNIDDEMFQPFQLAFSAVVVAKKLLNLGSLSLLKRDVVWVSAKNVFELAF